MKILEVTNVDFSLYQFLRPIMRGLSDRNHEVIGVCSDGPLVSKARQEGLSVITVPFQRSYSLLGQLKAFWAIYRVIKEQNPDIVHAHMPISGFLTRIAAYLCGTNTIAYTCHGYLFNQSGKGIKSLLRQSLSFFLEWFSGQITDIYMTVSQQEALDAKRYRIHKNPIYVGNGRDPQKFSPDKQIRAEVRKFLQTTEDCCVFLIASRFVIHKGYIELLAAFIALSKGSFNIQLWIVGNRLESDHDKDLQSIFNDAQLKLGSKLKILGYRGDVDQLMKAADIFILPSHFEGLPMSIIEAMLSALPVISTQIKGPQEQVVQGKTGLLVPPKSCTCLVKAMIWMVTHFVERRQMGVNGRARALEFFTEKKQIKKICDQLLSVENSLV